VEVRITITDQSATAEHAAATTPHVAASGPAAVPPSGEMGAATAMAAGAINAGPAPAELAATGASVAFIAATDGLAARPGDDAESGGPAPKL